MMKSLLLTSIEKALNTYLHCDDHSNRRLKKLAGKSIAVELLPLHLNFVCRFHDTRVTVDMGESGDHAAKIKGTPLQLLGVLIDKNHRHQFFADDVEMTGDAEFAQQVMNLFDRVEIDWEDQAAKLVGDVPAYQLNKLVSRICRWTSSTGQSFSQDVNDYLHEEAAWFPAKEELQEFFSDIDKMRMDTDRLEARIKHLRSQLKHEDKQ